MAAQAVLYASELYCFTRSAAWPRRALNWAMRFMSWLAALMAASALVATFMRLLTELCRHGPVRLSRYGDRPIAAARRHVQAVGAAVELAHLVGVLATVWRPRQHIAGAVGETTEAGRRRGSLPA